MTQSFVGGASWTCGCGRRVPGRIDTCRCGQSRAVERAPGPEETASGGADWAEQQAAKRLAATGVASVADAGDGGAADGGLFGAKSLIQFGAVVLAVALFFGSRYFNRYRVSNQIRGVVIAELAKDRGEDAATELVDKAHWGCFEPNYHMSFKRRGGSSTFDEEAYATCMLRALRR